MVTKRFDSSSEYKQKQNKNIIRNKQTKKQYRNKDINKTRIGTKEIYKQNKKNLQTKLLFTLKTNIMQNGVLLFKITGALSEAAELSIEHNLIDTTKPMNEVDLTDALSCLVTVLLDNGFTIEAISFFIQFIDKATFKLAPMYLILFSAWEDEMSYLTEKLETLELTEQALVI